MKSVWMKLLLCTLLLCLMGTVMVACGDADAPVVEPGDTEAHVCTFTKNVKDEFLRTAATCTAPAEYYYSCSCGLKSSQTFTSGQPAGHTYAAEWIYDGENHWHTATCGCEEEISDKGAHTYVSGVCSICQAPYSTPGLKFELNEEKTAYTLISSETVTGNVAIPDTYMGLPVTVIGDFALDGVSEMTSFKVPAHVTEIKSGAIYRLGNLDQIEVAAGNKTYAVANGCLIQPAEKRLVLATKNGTIPTDGSVTTIGGNAFTGNTTLKKLTVPNAVTTIEPSAFSACTELTELNVGNGVKTIGQSAFEGCSNLMSVTLGTSVESIGDMAFYGCPNLLEVCNLSSLSLGGEAMQMTYLTFFAVNVYGEGGQSCIVTIDDDFLFFDDGNSASLLRYTGTATYLTLPANCNGRSYAIHKFAFEGNEELLGVVIPDSVTAIGESAFAGCTNLNRVDMPTGYNCSLKTIGVNAFAGCRSLPSNIYIPASVTLIGQCAFYNSGITHVNFGNEMGWYRTPNPNYVGNKSQSTSTNFTNPANNAAMLRSTYYDCYFFR